MCGYVYRACAACACDYVCVYTFFGNGFLGISQYFSPFLLAVQSFWIALCTSRYLSFSVSLGMTLFLLLFLDIPRHLWVSLVFSAQLIGVSFYLSVSLCFFAGLGIFVSLGISPWISQSLSHPFCISRHILAILSPLRNFGKWPTRDKSDPPAIKIS